MDVVSDMNQNMDTEIMVLLTPSQVARRFAVDPKTVTRWANNGRIPFVRTPGGHRRYSKADIDALLCVQVEGKSG